MATSTHRFPVAAPALVGRRALARVTVWIVATVLLFSAAWGLGMALRPAVFTGQTWVHSVAPGESVWGLADSLNLQRPLESVVNDILTLNALDDATLLPGQQVLLPAE